MVSRESLKLASGVRFVHSLPKFQPVRLVARRKALTLLTEVRFFYRLPFRSLRLTGQGARLRTLKCAFDSHGDHQVTDHRPTGQGTVLRRPIFRFESGWFDQSLRVSPIGEERVCLTRSSGFDSRRARHVCRCLLVIGNLFLNQAARV